MLSHCYLFLIILCSLYAYSASWNFGHWGLQSKPLIPSGNSRIASPSNDQPWKASKFVVSLALATNLLIPSVAWARPEGVNRPELLPTEYTTVIDVANFLTKGQEKKIRATIDDLERQTGFKLRILCQSYPNTPGLAIKDYWHMDDNTVLVVLDRGEGFNRKNIPTNIINLNLGAEADKALPGMFWSRLTNKLGNTFYVKQNGEDVVVMNVVEAVSYCLKEGDCKDLPFTVK